MALIPEPMHDNWIGRHRALRASRRGLFAAAMAGGLAATLAERLPRWLGFSSSTTPDAGDGTLHMLGATSQIPVGGGKIFPRAEGGGHAAGRRYLQGVQWVGAVSRSSRLAVSFVPALPWDGAQPPSDLP